VINVRIAHAEPKLGPVVQPRGLHQRGFLVVLADDEGQRALPVWVPEDPVAIEIPDLLNRPADDIWATAGVAEELAVRLLDAQGASVTGVDIQPVTNDPDEVNPGTCAARVALGSAYSTASLDDGLRLALISGAPVRVDDTLMDRLAVDAPADDPAAPLRQPPEPRAPRGGVIVHAVGGVGQVLHVPGVDLPGPRPRFAPRNLDFADGLAGWHLEGSDDYVASAEDSTVVLSSAVQEPSGEVAVLQTIFADDLTAAPVVFRAEFRTEDLAGRAGLCLRVLGKGWQVNANAVRERVVTVTGSQDWTAEAIFLEVPRGTDVIRFGLVLAGRGRVRLRNPELRQANA
jgi:hypothetical protein